jgi:uncharacterized cupredoxin-like copper-binding protein
MTLPRLAVALSVLVFGSEAFSQSDETAFGQPGDTRKTTKTIEVKMTDDLEFIPSRIAVRQGETVRFLVTNSGKKRHEMVIGTLAGLEEHAAMMKNHRGMKHEAPYMAHVPSGKTETIVWQFTKAGDFYYACLVGHHFEDGMSGKITVVAR